MSLQRYYRKIILLTLSIPLVFLIAELFYTDKTWMPLFWIAVIHGAAYTIGEVEKRYESQSE